MMHKCLAFVFALGALGTGPGLIAGAQTMPAYGVNLVVNGDAEADKGAPSNNEVVKPKGWTTTGQFTALQYGASGGFPDLKSPGPNDRGLNLFEGGNVAKSSATQTIDLAPYTADIDAGSVRYAFSAWIGGFSSQEDNATVSVLFLATGGSSLGSVKLGPVTAKQRNSTTGLLQQQQPGSVPKGTRKAVVTIEITRTEGTYNDGSVDNVSLVFTKAP